jgi:hypothetical protein
MLLVFAEVEGDSFLKPFQILIPVQKNELQLALLVSLTEETDAFKS